MDEPRILTAGRPGGSDKIDYNTNSVACGRCGRPVPSGTARIVVNFHAYGWHQLFCPDHIPPNTRPWRPFNHDGPTPAES